MRKLLGILLFLLFAVPVDPAFAQAARGWWHVPDLADGDNCLTPRPNETHTAGMAPVVGEMQVNTFTGGLYLTRTDLHIPGIGPDLQFTFSYNSGETKYDYGFGGGWTNTFNTLYERLGSDLMIKRWDGNRDTFLFAGGAYTPPTGCYDSLRQYVPGKFRLRTKYGVEYFYDDSTHRKLTSVRDRNGNTTTISYSGGRQVLVTNAVGQSIALVWSGGKLSQLVDSISSPGRTISYQYDAQGNPTQVTYPLGVSVRYEYGPRKRITRVVDGRGTGFDVSYSDSGAVTRVQSPLSDEQFQYNAGTSTTTYTIDGRSTTYAYDGMRRLIDIAGACCGYHRAFTYDGNNNITSLTDADGYVTTYTYDGRGNRLTETDPLTHTVTWTYEPVFSQVRGVTDKRGNVTSYTYDGKGNLTGIARPLGVTESFTYNSFGLVVSATDPKGGVSTFTYDGNNRLAGIAHPIGSESFTHDNTGNMLSHTDGNGNVTSYTYDGLDRRLTMMNPLSEVTSYSYDANDNVTSIAGPDGNVTNFTYDGLNRKLQVTDGLGIVQTNTYNTAGELASSTDGNGNVTTFAYDANGRLTAVARDGTVATYTYDGRGNPLTAADGNGNVTAYTYDGLNRRLTSSLGGVTTTTGYDANSNVTSRADGKGNITTYTYDGLNRRTVETFPDATTVQYTYDANGNPATRTSNDGVVTTFAYDGNDRLTQRAAGSWTESYTYDGGNRLTAAANSNGTVSYTYDGLNRRLSETANGHTTSCAYNTATRQRTVTYPGGTVVQETRNLRQRIASLIDGPLSMAFTYDAGGRRSTVSFGGGVTGTYGYDGRDRTTALVYTRGATPVAAYSYAYDNADNRTAAIDDHDPVMSETYGFNALDWLTLQRRGRSAGGVVPDPADSALYSYDNAGNWTSVEHHGTTTYTTNNLNQYTSHSGGGWFRYDLNGNLTGMNHFSAAYDEKNQLVQAVDSTAGTGCRFTYDALGRRIQKWVTSDGGVTWGVTLNYYYDGWRVIEERSGSNVVLATYAYGDEGIDDILTMRRNGSTYYYLKNALGSVMAIADSAGNVVERYNYDAFGTPTILDVSPAWCPGNAVRNGSFADSAVAGPMPTGRSAGWSRAYGNPDVSLGTGCDSAVVGMWGNQHPSIGEAIQQILTTPIVQGQRYAITFCGKWSKEPTRPLPPKFVFRASNAPLTGAQDPNGVLIAMSPPVTDTLWQTYTLPDWVATGNYTILTVSISNQSSSSSGDSVTYSYVDRVCLRDITVPTSLLTSAVGNRFMFTAREYDAEIGIYYYRARYYHPGVGRFLRRDPLGDPGWMPNSQNRVLGEPVPGWEDLEQMKSGTPVSEQYVIAWDPGPGGCPSNDPAPSGVWGDESNLGNAYTYVGNNPTGFVDPLGLRGRPEDALCAGAEGLDQGGGGGKKWKWLRNLWDEATSEKTTERLERLKKNIDIIINIFNSIFK